MAKEKNQSPAEKLAAEIKANGVMRRRPTEKVYHFPQNILKKERDRLGLTIAQAQDHAGVTTLSAMEKGDNPNLASAMRVALFYGMPIEKLFGTLVLKTFKQPSGPAEVAQNEVEIPTEPLPFDDPE